MIFQFSCHREFLKEFLQKKIKEDKQSYRSLAAQAGFKSPNYFQMIINGKKNLNLDSARQVAESIGLKEFESLYFLELIKLDQTTNDNQRAAIHQEMDRLCQLGDREDVKDISIHSSWLNFILFELLLLKDFDFSIDNITAKLAGRAHPQDIATSFQFLLDKGYIELDESTGRYLQKKVQFVPFHGKRNLDIQRSHRRFLEMAKHRVADDLKERSFQGLTVATSKAKMQHIKRRIDEFMTELNQELIEDLDADTIVRVQCAAFKVVND